MSYFRSVSFGFIYFEVAVFITYKSKDCDPDPIIIVKSSPPPSSIYHILGLMLVLLYPALLWLAFVSVYPLPSFCLKYVTCKQYIIEFWWFIQAANLDFYLAVFSPFTLNVITYVEGFIVTILLFSIWPIYFMSSFYSFLINAILFIPFSLF